LFQSASRFQRSLGDTTTPRMPFGEHWSQRFGI